MKKLLLLDADVVIDLHTLGVFERIIKDFDVHLTKTVYDESLYFKSGGERTRINIQDLVTVIENIEVKHLEVVQKEAKEAGFGIDPGEMESIACMVQADEDFLFCTCDRAAIKLLSYMNLEGKSVSFEKALRSTGYQKKNLYPRHWEKTYLECIREGKTIRIQRKKLTET